MLPLLLLVLPPAQAASVVINHHHRHEGGGGDGDQEGRRYNPSDGYFWMGLTTLKVPMELFAENRRRLVAGLR